VDDTTWTTRRGRHDVDDTTWTTRRGRHHEGCRASLQTVEVTLCIDLNWMWIESTPYQRKIHQYVWWCNIKDTSEHVLEI